MRIKESEKTAQNKFWLSEAIKLKIVEQHIYEYMKKPWKNWFLLDRSLDDRNMMQVPLQDFFMYIKKKQEDIWEYYIRSNYDESRA